MKKTGQQNELQESNRVRFVILHHQPIDGEQNQFTEHWDFMVEDGEGLATWQLSKNPIDDPKATITANRIGKHRKAYLNYEGPVSNGRGAVRRIESGHCIIHKAVPSGWTLEFIEDHLEQRIELCCNENDQWTWCPTNAE